LIDSIDRIRRTFPFHRRGNAAFNEGRNPQRSATMNDTRLTLAQRIYYAMALFGLGLAGS
jgi:hypothetical protein